MGNLELRIPSVPDHGLSVRRFDISEGLSVPFEVALTATSASADLDFGALTGAEATFRLDRGALGARAWTGLVARIEQHELEGEGVSTYALQLVPRLFLLSLKKNHRIFQHQSALDIAVALLGEWGIATASRLDAAAVPRREVRVQYGETDLAFLSRLLEEAGLSYVLEDDGSGGVGSLVVLTDAPERAAARAEPVPFTTHASSSGTPFFSDVRVSYEVRPGGVTVADFDPRRPRYPLVYRAREPGPGEAPLERFAYRPGSALVDLPEAAAARETDTPAADDQSHARADEHQGYADAGAALGALRDDRRRVHFGTNLADLAPGVVFTVAGAPRPELAPGRRFVVVRSNLDGELDREWIVRGVAAFGSSPVRPTTRTPWPRIEGVQSAVVVGPAGKDGAPRAEIHTDELGRVRLRFPWDREGGYDDHRSAWVRVSEGWAGAGFGMIATPRVGEEVMVAFLEGNPDQPLVVGRLFDASNPPPHALPSGQARSTWRSRSSPASSGFHELTFDDTAGAERLVVQSQRDLEKTVLRAETETTEGNQTFLVGRNRGTTVGGDDHLAVGAMHEARLAAVGSMRIQEAGQPDAAPQATRRELVAQRITVSTGGATIQLDGPNITVSAQSGVRIQAGGTVVIQGEPFVHLNPPLVTRAADKAVPAEPADHLVSFRLVANGQPVGAARVHLVGADGTSSAPQVTDGNGRVRLPVDKPGAYAIRLGSPPPAPAAGAGPASPSPAAASAPAAAPAAVEVGKTPAQPPRNAKATEHAVPVELTIVSPAPASTFEIDPGDYPTPAPSMPSVKLHARVLVQGAPVTTGTVSWELKITGKYRVRQHHVDGGYRLQAFDFPAGTARTRPDEEATFLLAPAELVGGDLVIKATYSAGAELGDVTVTKVLSGCKVTGKNPPRAVVEKAIVAQAGDLAWLYLRMFCHESDHRLAQFKAGLVLYGPPSGVGIVQRDPEEGEWVWPANRLTTPNNFFPRIFWDWRKNVVEGVTSFQSDYVHRARKELDGLRAGNPQLPAASDGVLMRAAIRHYNGGTEYSASDDGKHYVVDPSTVPANVSYVDLVLRDAHGTAPSYPVPADATARIWPVER